MSLLLKQFIYNFLIGILAFAFSLILAGVLLMTAEVSNAVFNLLTGWMMGILHLPGPEIPLLFFFLVIMINGALLRRVYFKNQYCVVIVILLLLFDMDISAALISVQ